MRGLGAGHERFVASDSDAEGDMARAAPPKSSMSGWDDFSTSSDGAAFTFATRRGPDLGEESPALTLDPVAAREDSVQARVHYAEACDISGCPTASAASS